MSQQDVSQRLNMLLEEFGFKSLYSHLASRSRFCIYLCIKMLSSVKKKILCEMNLVGLLSGNIFKYNEQNLGNLQNTQQRNFKIHLVSKPLTWGICVELISVRSEMNISRIRKRSEKSVISQLGMPLEFKRNVCSSTRKKEIFAYPCEMFGVSKRDSVKVCLAPILMHRNFHNPLTDGQSFYLQTFLFLRKDVWNF